MDREAVLDYIREHEIVHKRRPRRLYLTKREWLDVAASFIGSNEQAHAATYYPFGEEGAADMGWTMYSVPVFHSKVAPQIREWDLIRYPLSPF